MKILLLISLLLITSATYSQKPINAKYNGTMAIGVSSGMGLFSGNNFIAKSYNTNYPISINVQFHLYKNIGIGFLYQHSNASLKSTEYVGLSTVGKFGRFGSFVGYYGKLGNKFLIEPKIGMGILRIRNILDNSFYLSNGSYDYKTWGNYTSFSTDFDYFINKNLSLFANVDYSYLAFPDVHASTETGVSYHSSNLYGVQLGVKFWAR